MYTRVVLWASQNTLKILRDDLITKNPRKDMLKKFKGITPILDNGMEIIVYEL